MIKGYNSLKAYPSQSPPLVLLDQAVGFSIAVNSSPCPCSSLGLSTGHSPLEVYLLWNGLIHEPQSLQKSTYCVVDLSMASNALGSTCSGVDLLMGHSHFEVSLLWHSPFHWPQTPAVSWSYPQPDTSRCSGMSLSMDTARCTCYTAWTSPWPQTLWGVRALMWTHPQLTVPLT